MVGVGEWEGELIEWGSVSILHSCAFLTLPLNSININNIMCFQGNCAVLH